MKNNTINISNITTQPNIIYKRLLSIAYYDYLELQIKQLTIYNVEKIKNLNLIYLNRNTDELVNWLLEGTNKPTKAERLLLYNQLQAPTRYIKSIVKTSTTNLLNYKGNIDIKNKVLPDDLLVLIQNFLINQELTPWDYNVFLKIKW